MALLNLKNVKPRLGDPEIFCDKFTPFCEKKILLQKFCCLKKNNLRITTIADNMKGHLRFLYFHILNIAKFG